MLVPQPDNLQRQADLVFFDRRLRQLLAAGLLPPVLLGGCFSYGPLRQPSPPRASSLRLHLSTPGSYSLGDVTINDVAIIDGELVTMDSAHVIVSATRLVARSGFEHLGQDATLSVPRAQIGSIEMKRLSPARTILFGAALVAGASIIGAAGAGAFSGSSGSGGGGKTQ